VCSFDIRSALIIITTRGFYVYGVFIRDRFLPLGFTRCVYPSRGLYNTMRSTMQSHFSSRVRFINSRAHVFEFCDERARKTWTIQTSAKRFELFQVSDGIRTRIPNTSCARLFFSQYTRAVQYSSRPRSRRPASCGRKTIRSFFSFSRKSVVGGTTRTLYNFEYAYDFLETHVRTVIAFRARLHCTHVYTHTRRLFDVCTMCAAPCVGPHKCFYRTLARGIVCTGIYVSLACRVCMCHACVGRKSIKNTQ
jgi:hypothetical protein